MDAFIDYLYYTGNGGTSISASEFDGYATRASYQVDHLTLERAEAIITAGTGICRSLTVSNGQRWQSLM